MQNRKAHASNAQWRVGIRIAGIIVMASGLILLGGLLGLGNSSIPLLALALVLIVVGMLLTASPGVTIAVLEAILSWVG